MPKFETVNWNTQWIAAEIASLFLYPEWYKCTHGITNLWSIRTRSTHFYSLGWQIWKSKLGYCIWWRKKNARDEVGRIRICRTCKHYFVLWNLIGEEKNGCLRIYLENVYGLMKSVIFPLLPAKLSGDTFKSPSCFSLDLQFFFQWQKILHVQLCSLFRPSFSIFIQYSS